SGRLGTLARTRLTRQGDHAMPGSTAIEWTGASWNPVTGCTQVSAGCDHCYAKTFAERWRGIAGHPFEQGFDLRLWPDRLPIPLRWTKPRRIFVNSMSDLFHAHIPETFIQSVFATMAASPQHTFQVLTKRPRRMQAVVASPEFAAGVHHEFATLEPPGIPAGCLRPPWPGWPLPNVWLGVSVESQAVAWRIDWLVRTPAVVRFLSCEPLLGPLDLGHWLPVKLDSSTPYVGTQCDETGCERTAVYQRAGREFASLIHECADHDARVDWVIVGGESDPQHRPFDPDWARSIRDQCAAADVPFFFKQFGGRTPKAGGRLLDGRTWDEFPTSEVTR
ncbi:MAG TPA: phage Gp37/Gp68 family protein, partial [Thermomicrobiales bacterium]|nr:phage Gp37/Gp68 family protein [Thermomicrobiales bacterium]